MVNLLYGVDPDPPKVGETVFPPLEKLARCQVSRLTDRSTLLGSSAAEFVLAPESPVASRYIQKLA